MFPVSFVGMKRIYGEGNRIKAVWHLPKGETIMKDAGDNLQTLDLNDLGSVAAGFHMYDLTTEENMRYVELVKNYRRVYKAYEAGEATYEEAAAAYQKIQDYNQELKRKYG